MFRRNEVFQAIPFDASSDVNEALIAAGDAEEADHRLEEKALFRFKLSSLFLGLLVGFFGHFFILVGTVLFITISGEDVVTKCKIDIFVCFGLLCSFFFWASASVISRFLRNLVATTYSAIGGRSKDLLEEMVLDMRCGFVLGILVGLSLAWKMEAVLLGTRAQTVYSYVTVLVVAFFWCKIMMMYFATHIKPSSSRRSTAEQTTV
jgi:hypothetical protein